MDKARILIVDDQAEILDSLGAILADEGHEVLRAQDGQEALHIVQSDSPDVVFLDIWIPGIDGMQTLRAIKRINPQCSVVMMSGHGTIETAVKAIKLGATDYLEKPINLEDVLHIVQKSIRSREDSARSQEPAHVRPTKLIGISEKAVALRGSLGKAAQEAGSIWLTGPKGTGKEFLARMIHYLERKDRDNLIKVRCTDLDEQGFDQALVGKMALPSGDRSDRTAKLAAGTLLLVRVDRLEPSLCARLASFLRKHMNAESRTLRVRDARLRIVSTATNDPEILVKEAGFPSDLAGLLADRLVKIPPLAERSKDIPVFVDHFLKEAVEEFDRDITGIDGEAMARLMAYSWPGNVKELKILIEHMVMTAPGPHITVNDLLIPAEDQPPGVSANVRLAAPQAPVSRDSGAAPIGSRPVTVAAPRSSAGTSSVQEEESFRHQKTIRSRVVMYGQGLHSGIKTGLTLSPLAPSSGIIFGHITSGDTVQAVLENVDSTDLSTCLRSNGSSARTIEHLMAVFHAYGLTNVLVKISGEVPIMDGSALEFCKLVESAETIPQDELIEEIRIVEPLELPLAPNGPKQMRIEPSDAFEVEYFLDYPPPIGKMQLHYRFSGPEDFKAQIAPARTFGFVRDMRMMDEMGLAGGGRLSNVILLDDEKVVNPPLRFPDEFVRHKILDIVGDFYLLGRPIRGKIIAKQTGHTENIALLRLIAEKL
ncbi:MAG: UDP-3-O-[3-hydroxymyristoyl] N-acetylglucosamine deacetylase [Desulfomonile tiedjei]|nr:UDP-3-O-[3-hydroxymyristoyl] N-acetylglucosamine deacetylase [Desulfomonile tiedjei]